MFYESHVTELESLLLIQGTQHTVAVLDISVIKCTN